MKSLKLIFLLCGFFSSVAIFAQIDHTLWDKLLSKYVSAEGKVNYQGFKKDPLFAQYLNILSKAKLSDKFSSNERKAFWINVYNAFTIKLITDNYPVKSIRDIEGAWDKKFIDIGGQKYSLNQVENEVLRPVFKDARIHFAINCAAISCPRLHNKAFTAANVEELLQKLTSDFINNPAFNSITASGAKISQIFEWYAVDFVGPQGIIGFLNTYAKVKANPNAKISYFEYNWALNAN
jgi:hypothetical protein